MIAYSPFDGTFRRWRGRRYGPAGGLTGQPVEAMTQRARQTAVSLYSEIGGIWYIK